MFFKFVLFQIKFPKYSCVLSLYLSFLSFHHYSIPLFFNRHSIPSIITSWSWHIISHYMNLSKEFADCACHKLKLIEPCPIAYCNSMGIIVVRTQTHIYPQNICRQTHGIVAKLSGMTSTHREQQQHRLITSSKPRRVVEAKVLMMESSFAPFWLFPANWKVGISIHDPSPSRSRSISPETFGDIKLDVNK